MDSFATTVSVALQYGVPLRDLVNKFAHVRFEPSGFTGNQEIPIAKSIVDYIFRWLGSRFLSTDEKATLGLIDRSAITRRGDVTRRRPPLRFPPGQSAHGVGRFDTEPGGTARGLRGGGSSNRLGGSNLSRPRGSAPESASESAPQGSASEATPREELAVDRHQRSRQRARGQRQRQGREQRWRRQWRWRITMSLGATKVSFQTQADAPSCAECGSIMVRNGSCYKCLNCGSTSGCS